jgi:hypothetical protein
MKVLYKKTFTLLLLAAFCIKQAKAFDSTFHKPVNATILLPLYLDSAFKNGSYQYGNAIPKHMLPALEFYNGVQLAADSLKQEGIIATLEIVDSRKANAIQQVYREYNPVKPQLVIGVMQNAAELKQASDLAFAKKIPFISATYPNDGGVSSNPSLVILNSTLRTHCMALYKYLQRNFRSGNIVLCTRKGSADERIKNYLLEAQKTMEGEKIKWKVASLPDSFNAKQLAMYLDSNKTNTVIGASLDKDFSLHVIEHLSGLKDNYNSAIFGMPTWDEFPLQKKEYKGVDVYYSTPFISFSGNAAAYTSITKKFTAHANSKPSDMVFKGFEITYRYIKTLYENPQTFWENMNNPKYKLFADFNIEVVAAKANENSLIKYWENNKIYFVKKTDGAIKGVY